MGDSNWREILDYFQPAFQIGMTATPRRQDNADTYPYFGDPIYQYSLRQRVTARPTCRYAASGC